MQSYSQGDEQETILKFFGVQAEGRLLDIGAHNGMLFSNSLALLERGWSGVCVEPSPVPFRDLMKLHAGRPVELVQAAVGTEAGWLTFHDSGGDAISTTDAAHKAKWELGYGVKFQPFHVYTVTVAHLLARFGRDFDFVTLDVEGINWPLFQHFPLAEMPRLRLFCVEHDGHQAEMLARAEPYGFRRVAINGENLILGREL